MSSPPPDPAIYTRQVMARPVVVDVGSGSAAVFSARSPAKPTDNEDGAALVTLDDDRSVLVVADGVGGHAAGAEAAGIALESVLETVAGTSGDDNAVRAAILSGIELANRRVTGLALGAGTTVAVVEVDGRRIRPYHVGDSAILAVGQRGKLKMETMAHSPVGYAVQAGMLDASEAMHHEARHLVSNIVGTEQMRIEVGPWLDLRQRDSVLLATDGVFDNLHVPEVIELIRAGPLAACAQELASTARERMCVPSPEHPSKPDDCTFVLYRPLRTKS